MSRGLKSRKLIWLCAFALLVLLSGFSLFRAAVNKKALKSEISPQEILADKALERRLDGSPKNPAAWYALGNRYFQGIDGLPQDYERAYFYWIKPAEKNNYGPALHGIGALYLNGFGVEKNAATAHHWFRRAASQNYPPSFYQLGRLYDEGNGVARNPAAAAEWYRRGILFGDKDAMYALGHHYYAGDGVKKSYGNAYRLWLKCAESGNVNAQFNIGALYENGKGVAKDPDLARQWYDKAAQQGHEGALQALEEMLILKN